MHKASRVLTATAVPLGCAYRYTATTTTTRLPATSAVASSACRMVSHPASWCAQQHPARCATTALRPLQRCATPLSAHTTFLTAGRNQHAGSAAAAGSAETTAKAETSSPHQQQQQQSSEGGNGVHVDPRRLPSTIPGISQEELAARITAYHSKKAQEASALSNKALTEEIELMRRSLSPNDFAAYMQSLEKGMAAAAKEQAKLAAMSPVELHHYQQKKRRQAVRYEWYKTFLMIFALVGSTALLFSLFLFFE